MTIPEQLVEYVRSAQAVLILCDGVGGQSDAALPKDLRDAIALEFLDPSFLTRTLAEIVELASSEAGALRVQQFIARKYIDAQPTEPFFSITHFRWVALASTLIDLRIERAYQQSKQNALQECCPVVANDEDLDRLLTNRNSLMYLKLHGCASHAAEVNNPLVVSVDQYASHLGRRTLLFERLATLATEYPVVIVGNSLSSPDVRAIVRTVASTHSARPRSYIVTEASSPADQRLLDSYKVSSVAIGAEQFFSTLEQRISRAQRVLSAVVRHDDQPIARRFVSNVRRPTESLASFLANDVEYLAPGQATPIASPQEFYRGHLRDWSPIEHGFDIERTISEELLAKTVFEDDETSKDTTFHLLRGHSGAGKTVVLRRLAWDAAMEWGRLCLYTRSVGVLQVEPLLELYELCNQRIFLFVDQVTNHVEGIQQVLLRARRERLPLTVVATERHHAWNMLGARIANLVTDSYELRYLNEDEIDRLIDKLDEHNSLGSLQGRPRRDQQEALAKRAGRQLLVALHEATLGRPFTEIVLDEYNSVSSQQARSLYLTVCVLHRLGVQTRAGLISRVHGIPFHRFKSEFFQPLESIVFARKKVQQYDYYYESRHSHIAEIVFEGVLTDAEARFDEYMRILSALDTGYESDKDAFKYLLSARELRKLFPKIEMVRRLYDLACRRYPDDPVVFQQRGLYEMSSAQGDLDEASRAFQRAQVLAPNSAHIRHSVAELLIRRAGRATRPGERERLRADARKLLKEDSPRRDNSAYTQHSILKIDLAELAERIDARDDVAVEKKVLDIEKTIGDALQESPSDEYILQAEASFAELLKNAPRAFLALKKAFSENKRSPYIAIRLSKTFLGQGDIGGATATLREYLDQVPHDRDVHYQMGRCLVDNEIGTPAEVIYHLRESFTKGDSRYEAQFWYARALYLSGQTSEAKEMFQTLSNAEISPRERLRPRGLTRGQRYGGSIARMDRSFGYVRRDIANDLVYSREDGDHKLDFSALKVGQRVTYSLGFNFRGPIAMEIDSEGVSKRPLVGASARECDVGILVALREEFRELIAAIGSNYVVDRDKETANTYYVFDHPHGRPEARRCVATMIGEMGPDKAVLLGERFIAKWKPDVLVVVGIAASLSSDLCVGDVCLAVQVDSYLEAGKAENKNGDSDAEDFVLKPGGAAYRVNKGMVEDVRNLEFAEPRIFEAWQQRGQQRLGKAIATDVRERLVAAGLARAAPVLEDCYLASGPVVGAGSAFVSWILRRDRRYKALDMESGGAMIAAAERAVPQRMVVVRGISDFGDERKTQLDKVGDGALRRYAMQNAIDFVFALVENGILESEA